MHISCIEREEKYDSGCQILTPHPWLCQEHMVGNKSEKHLERVSKLCWTKPPHQQLISVLAAAKFISRAGEKGLRARMSYPSLPII